MSESNSSTSGAGSAGINRAFASNKFFSADEQSLEVLGFGGFGSPYPKLRPKGAGIVDVVNKMIWKNSGSSEEVPIVYLTERELKYGTWTANLLQILQQAGNLLNGQNVDSYLALYAAEKTGFSYNLPYLAGNDSNLRNLSNTWNKSNGLGELFKSFSGGSPTGDILGAAVGTAVGVVTPGVGFEETYQYGNTSLQELTITFPLYNTISQEAAFDHYSFVQLFTFQNLKIRTSLLTFIPPKIYTVDTFTNGGIYMAAAYVSNLKIDSIGTTRRMRDFSTFGAGEILIPEAYRVSITFTDLVSQSANIFAGTMGGNKIEVTSGANIGDIVNNFTSGAVGTFNSISNTFLNGAAGIANGPGAAIQAPNTNSATGAIAAGTLPPTF